MTGESLDAPKGCPHLPAPADGWALVDRLASVSRLLLQPRPDVRAALGLLIAAGADLLTEGWVAVVWSGTDRSPDFLAVTRGGEPTSVEADLPAALAVEVGSGADDSGNGSASEWIRTPLTAEGRAVGTLLVEGHLDACHVGCRWSVVLRAVADHCALALRGTGRAVTVHDSLTEREGEVLRLLARGSSNREIARSLFVSESTAKFHVANVMRKLDVTRRAQVAYVTGGPSRFEALDSA